MFTVLWFLFISFNNLDRVMRTAKDAREAYSRGRDQEGNQRIAELKAVVELVSTFVIPNTKSASTSSISSLAEHRVSPPSGRTASRKASLSGPTPALQAPSEDASRKRCASAQGDRVLKSLKLEAKDDSVVTSLSSGPSSGSSSSGMPGSISGPPSATLSAPPAASSVLAQTPIPPPLLHSQTFPGNAHSHATHQGRQQHMPSHLDPLSLSTSYSTPTSSRSETSSGGNGSNAAMAHQLALLQQQQHTPQHPHSLQHSHSHPSHHAPSVHSPLSLNTPKMSTVANGKTAPPTGWSDASMISPLQAIIPPTAASQAQAPRFRGPGPTDPPSHSASFRAVSTHAPLPPSVRPSRSSSTSGAYPFAFNPPTSTMATTGLEDAFDPSRPSTSVSHAESSSPDLESDRENSPGRYHGTRGEGYMGHHPNNEIPLELKGDVDRIFFQFLSMICSDRKRLLLSIMNDV